MRALISGLVARVRPFDEREAADQADILAWVASGQELFRLVPPDTPPKHLVVYFIPVDAANRCLLLGDHRRSGLWLPPGGHVEDGEAPREAVIREAREELGIAAEFHDDKPFFLTVTPTNGASSHLDVDLWFVLKVTRDETRITPDPREFKSVRWFDVDGQRAWPAGRYDPEMRRFAAKLRSALEPAREEQQARKIFGRSVVTQAHTLEAPGDDPAITGEPPEEPAPPQAPK